MENSQHELYEYARMRLVQKKRLYTHFIIFVLGCILVTVFNKILHLFSEYNWFLWVIAIWSFLFTLHFINVFITNSFMNKNWERTQIDKLIQKQERKIEQFQKNIDTKPTDS